jgi:hypothetical protein
MRRIRTEKVVIDVAKNPDECFSIHATDEGTLEVTCENEGVKHVVTFTPEEWARFAVGGIELGVIARSAAAQRAPTLSPAALAEAAAQVARFNKARS